VHARSIFAPGLARLPFSRLAAGRKRPPFQVFLWELAVYYSLKVQIHEALAMSVAEAPPPLKLEQLSSASEEDPALAWRFLHFMSMMREIEDRIERKLYRQGKILGGVYVGRGQEAICVGSAILTEREDVLFPSHRDMAVFLIRGVHPRQIFAQYMGRIGGLTRGRDGNMHMGDISLNIVSIISAMAASVPVAGGAALALKYKGTRNIAMVYFGDGATSRGDWHEGVNFAAVQKLPVVYICNNNQWAYSTPLEKQMACESIAARGPAYGISSELVDGNDIFAVHHAARRAIEHARAGLGPYLIECKTFRMTGHSAHDPADYVPKHLWTEWAARDPIARLEKLMLDRGWAGQVDIEREHQQIRDEVDAAIAWAEQSPYPDASELLDRVYDEK
jgi:pyruvate dehydrogenase E1 component alpha subunit